MVSEGLHEVLHAAARGEQVTGFMFNNGVFGDTGGQMTADHGARAADQDQPRGPRRRAHGYPSGRRLLAQLRRRRLRRPGRGQQPRASIARTKRIIRRAIEPRWPGPGFTFVEVLTMCPTGGSCRPRGPEYLEESMMETFGIGELKAPAAE